MWTHHQLLLTDLQASGGCLVSCSVQHPVPLSIAQAPCSRSDSSSCSSSDSTSSVACSAHTWHEGQALSSTTAAARGSVADAFKQAEVFAAPGSSCSPDSLSMLQQMEAAAGGRFYIISCGKYAEQHPHAGKPARAHLQVVLVSMRPDPTGASPCKVKKRPQEVSIVQQPQDMSNPMLYFMVYELGQDGWPCRHR
jgi:hypothetical protein